MKKRWVYIFIVSVLATTTSYGVGFYSGVGKGQDQFPRITPVTVTVDEGSGKPADINLGVLWEAYRALKERFVDQSKLDPEKLVRGAISGFVSSAGDPYTVYVGPEDQQKFVEDLQGSFGGIGAEIGMRKGILVVIAPLDGSPAEKAGLKAGDRILKIDDTISADLTVDEAVQHIRGPVGTSVTLVILPEGGEKTKDVKITRQTIVVPSLKWEVKDGIGIVRILNFDADAARAFERLLGNIRKLPQKKLIIDLRNNPGGFLDVSQDIASFFLPKGDVVVYEVDAGGNRLPFVSRGFNVLAGYSMVVLINQGSASASEILAGALRDKLGVRLVGEKSYGKGSVQELVNLSDGSVLKITVAKWLTPNGTSINDEGLKPDIEVKMPEETKEGEEAPDVQLEKALELLK